VGLLRYAGAVAALDFEMPESLSVRLGPVGRTGGWQISLRALKASSKAWPQDLSLSDERKASAPCRLSAVRRSCKFA
jgi:hypothetical protein